MLAPFQSREFPFNNFAVVAIPAAIVTNLIAIVN